MTSGEWVGIRPWLAGSTQTPGENAAGGVYEVRKVFGGEVKAAWSFA